MKKISYFITAIGLFTLVNSCAVNPVTGKKQVVLMSESQEVALGLQSDPQILAEYGLYENQTLQNFINNKGNQMAAISHRPNLKYSFKIVDSEVVNAFAVPGGYVYFTRGIMAHFNNEAEFAGVLGHEIGHITARHSVSQQTNAMLGQVGLIAGMVLSPTVAKYGQQASEGLGLLFLKFGRDAERQSDELGVEYSSKINYDAREMAGFFSTLERLSGDNENQLPSFLSTHPNPGERLQTVNKLANDWQAKEKMVNPMVNRNSYLKMIDGLIYGPDPKQGFFENNMFYHPVLKYQLPVPANWKHNNSPQSFQMSSPDSKGFMILSLVNGASLQEAANATIQKYGLTVVQNNQQTVNGMNVIQIIADQPANAQQQSPALRTISHFISYGNLFYHIIGVSTQADFNSYSNLYSSSLNGFKELTNQEIINRKPDRIKIITVANTTTLQQLLNVRGEKDPKKQNEISILNGMTLTQSIPKGMMVKVISK